MAMLENLLHTFKVSRPLAPQDQTQTGGYLDALAFSEPDLSADGRISAVITDPAPDVHWISQSDQQSTQPPPLPPESPAQLSPLQPDFNMPSLGQAGTGHQSTQGDIILLSTNLVGPPADLLRVDSSCMDISLLSDDEGHTNTTCDITDLPAATMVPVNKPLVWTSAASTSDEGEEGSCIYSAEAVGTYGESEHWQY